MRKVLRIEEGSPEAKIFQQRIRYFLVDNEGRQTISIRLGDREYEVGTSESNGHFRGTLRLSAAKVEQLLDDQDAKDGWLSFEAVTRKSDNRRFAGQVQMIGRHGLSVISDIDDTIKHSQVGELKAVLANTFLRDLQPAPGMVGAPTTNRFG